MSRTFIGVGANVGDRLWFISAAIDALVQERGVHVEQIAPIIETEPVGGPPQGAYLNTVVELTTSLAPRSLLELLKDIERRLGRRGTGERWGPRVIDLDLLLCDDVVMHEPDLTLPHPRLHERRFVLEPMAQLAPALQHPTIKQSIAVLLERTGRGDSCGAP